MPRIVRQWESRDGSVFTQWQDDSVTLHFERDDLDHLDEIATMPYIKETDYEAYPQRVKFHSIIARHYRTNYNVALFEGLIPPLPKPVTKLVKYGKAGNYAVVVLDEDEAD